MGRAKGTNGAATAYADHTRRRAVAPAPAHTPAGSPLASRYHRRHVTSWPVIAKSIASEYLQNIGLDGDELGAIACAAYETLLKLLNTSSDGISLMALSDGSEINGYLGKIFAQTLASHTNNLLRPGDKKKEDSEKDVECDQNPELSLEIKTTKSKFSDIMGNASYLHSTTKSHDSMYVAIEFAAPGEGRTPQVNAVALGYLKADDWEGRGKSNQRIRLLRDSKRKLYPVWKRS